MFQNNLLFYKLSNPGNAVIFSNTMGSDPKQEIRIYFASQGFLFVAQSGCIKLSAPAWYSRVKTMTAAILALIDLLPMS